MTNFLKRLRLERSTARPETAPRKENKYDRQLTSAEIAAGEHRNFVGGMWEEIGQLQFEFLKRSGLKPEHRLADIGCGSLRGGVHFVRYLEKGRYHGIDLNASLIAAGKEELKRASLLDKGPQLKVTDCFDLAAFGVQFDFALAVSVFTHLYANHIGLCLRNVRDALAPGGIFFATFFEAPQPLHKQDISHQPGGIITHLDRDPFHYSIAEMMALADFAGLAAKYVGEWNHPRAQRMLQFTRKD